MISVACAATAPWRAPHHPVQRHAPTRRLRAAYRAAFGALSSAAETDENPDVLHVTRTWQFLPGGEMVDE